MAPPAPGQDAGALQLQVLIGRVPSTGLGMADSAVVARRADVFATLRALPPSLPNGWRLRLLADHRVAVLSDTPLALPTSITALLTTLTMFLLSLGPYLDLLDAAGVEASAGMANT